jgi:hypothetical protein
MDTVDIIALVSTFLTFVLGGVVLLDEVGFIDSLLFKFVSSFIVTTSAVVITLLFVYLDRHVHRD